MSAEESAMSVKPVAWMPWMKAKWQSYWRTDEEGHADCGIFYETLPGQAYALLHCPRYMPKEEWEALCAFVTAAPELAEALQELTTRIMDCAGDCPHSVVKLAQESVSLLARITPK